MNIVVDIETDSLDATKIHCIVARNTESGDNYAFVGDDCYNKFPKFIEKHAEKIIMHNGVAFDAPILNRLAGTNIKLPQIEDTLIMSQLFNPERINGHSLDSWGKRFGLPKLEFNDFSKFTNEMLTYCRRDVELTHKVYNQLKLEGNKFSNSSLRLEHDIRSIVYKQEQTGFYIDQEKAMSLSAKLEDKAEQLEKEVHKTFPPIKREEEFIPKANNKKRGYVKGQLFIKVKYEDFNPSSRRHIAERLKLKYNWKPKEYTNDGLAKIDDKILNSLDYPEAKLLARYFLLEKRIGMLAEGKQAYLKLERNSRLHGTVNTNSAITQRATHSNPNLGQVPAVTVPYGKQFRELFIVPKGKAMCGVDISSLEIRLLGHYIAKYDNGAYANLVVNGDIHTENQKLAGLDTRDQSKRFLYAWLYGAGVNKIAEVTGKSSKDAAQVRTRFLNRLPALSKLIKQVQLSSERGYLVGLDRRQVKIRSVHAALNTLLQSAGAIVCKQWLVEFNKSVKHIEGVQQLLWVHDEIQIECPEDKAEEVGKLAVESIKKTGEHFNLRVPLTGEYKISNNWSGTH